MGQFVTMIAARYMNRRTLTAMALGSTALLASAFSLAQTTIRHPGAHPDYAVELEPHLAFGLFDPPGVPTGTGIGGGLRVTIPVMQNGFVTTINNSVGISFGIDYVHYEGSAHAAGHCVATATAPGPTSVCTLVDGPVGGPSNYLYLPVAMQWNFWLTEQFSAFGEPGVAVYHRNARYELHGHTRGSLVAQAGGRWHFSRLGALTFRLGYPTISLGVSLFL